MLLPIEVVEQPHDAPELLVLGVELAREVAHGLLNGLAVLDMEGILVVLGQKRERLVARHTGGKLLCHESPFVVCRVCSL